jgi:hypothetical protein
VERTPKTLTVPQSEHRPEHLVSQTLASPSTLLTLKLQIPILPAQKVVSESILQVDQRGRTRAPLGSAAFGLLECVRTSGLKRVDERLLVGEEGKLNVENVGNGGALTEFGGDRQRLVRVRWRLGVDRLLVAVGCGKGVGDGRWVERVVDVEIYDRCKLHIPAGQLLFDPFQRQADSDPLPLLRRAWCVARIVDLTTNLLSDQQAPLSVEVEEGGLERSSPGEARLSRVELQAPDVRGGSA